MKIGIVLTLLFASFHAFGANSSNWLPPPPASIASSNHWQKIPDTAFFEVPVSRFSAAESRLGDAPFLLQADRDVAYFGRPDYKCPESSQPYLLRAEYVNGANGRFAVYWAGSTVIVFHGSLGREYIPLRSALIACLSNPPTAVYSSIAGAI